MNRRFSELASQVLNAFWEENPVEATFAGVHAYDGVLPRTDAVSRAAYSRQRIASLESLKKFEARSDELEAEPSRRAERRIPKFVWEYLDSATGSEAGR